jgi:hypothetical protein
MQNQARYEPHADSQQESQRGKEGTFFLVSSLQAIQIPGLADLGRRGCLGAQAGSEQEYGSPAAALCCCTRPKSWGQNFEFIF